MNITDAEWKIMEVLWDKSPLTVRELTDILTPKTKWKRHTVISFLNRLENKGAIKEDPKNKIKAYVPLVSRELAVKAETMSFIEKVHRGSLFDYVSYFSPEKKLSDAERDALQSLIEKLESED